MKLVDERINALKTQNFEEQKEALSHFRSRECLKDLQSNFVLAPIDKATGNISFICKRFYVKILLTELGLLGGSSKTYKRYRGSQENLIRRQLDALEKDFNIKPLDENKCLPHIYWLPKMHKTPIKFRFIVAAPVCATKPLSKALASIFKRFYHQIELYNAKSSFFSGVKTFWVIQNNEPVIT